MQVCILSSGSKGNTAYIAGESAKILIDMGNTSKYVTEKLGGLGVDPGSLDGILITHTHSDHINGLKVFLKKYNVPVYITDVMLKRLDFLENYRLIREEFYIKDIHINAIKTSHDTEDSRGYVVSCNGKSVVYITDTGYIDDQYFDLLRNRDLYVMESNHDVEMVNNGSYPDELKQRILSNEGHLSNDASSEYLNGFIGDKTKYIILAHLSENNNTPEIAHKTLVRRLEADNRRVNNIIVARQKQATDLITL